jgi:uncharacterized OB-fold protein
MNEPQRDLLPDLEAPLTAPFWRAARDHKLVMQRCGGCGQIAWPPKPLCSNCWRPMSDDDWTEVADTGEIWSFVVYHRAFHPSFADKLPYNVAYIRLDGGQMFISNVVDTNDLEIGRRVRAQYDAVTPEATLVRFRLMD